MASCRRCGAAHLNKNSDKVFACRRCGPANRGQKIIVISPYLLAPDKRRKPLGPNQLRAIERRHPWIRPLRQSQEQAAAHNERMRQSSMDADRRLYYLRSRLP